jgi:predicted transposase YbfD/YdcC
LQSKRQQPSLYKQIQTVTAQTTPSTIDYSFERCRDRKTHRKVSVFEDISGISSDWIGLKRLIKVERTGTRAGLPYEQIVYYISSLKITAVEFARGIRDHWGIENRLHWVKDMVFCEDRSRIRTLHAPANFSIIRAIVINLLRLHGYTSLTNAIRRLAHDLDAIFLLFVAECDST